MAATAALDHGRRAGRGRVAEAVFDLAGRVPPPGPGRCAILGGIVFEQIGEGLGEEDRQEGGGSAEGGEADGGFCESLGM